jgi:hypothetical protein
MSSKTLAFAIGHIPMDQVVFISTANVNVGKMDGQILDTLIKVASPLLGVIVGWVLHRLFEKGKLIIYQYEWEAQYMHTDNEGRQTFSTKFNEAETYQYRFQLDVYNSGSYTRTMRDIRICLYDHEKCLLCKTPSNVESLKETTVGILRDEIKGVNVLAKTTEHIGLVDLFSQSTLQLLEKTTNMKFQYKNERNKEIVMNIPSFQPSYEYFLEPHRMNVKM